MGRKRGGGPPAGGATGDVRHAQEVGYGLNLAVEVALVQRDYSVLLGVFFVSSAMVVCFNIATDLVYRIVDPRIEAHA